VTPPALGIGNARSTIHHARRHQAIAGQDDHAWKRRTLALIETNPRQVTESSPQALFQAAACPEAVAAGVALFVKWPRAGEGLGP